MDHKTRCRWCNINNPLYVDYHDTEWCRKNINEHYLYEMLILESFQAGLSWECILNKREAFRKAFDQFTPTLVASYNDDKINTLMQNTGIVRNRRKIQAAIRNSKIFLDIAKEYGSFYHYLCRFTNDATIYEIDKTTSSLSDSISKDLIKRGMTFVGSTIIYSYLQAIGVIVSHESECFLHHPSKE